MLRACIDIGTNTTRLFVGEPGPDGVREVLSQRVFTRISRGRAADGTISGAKLAEVVAVVDAMARAARALGCADVAAIGTAPVRLAPNREELIDLVGRIAGLRLHVLSGDEEARLAFAGATRTMEAPPAGTVAVIDLGGGSTELAAGTLAEGVSWWRSLPVGSGTLTDAHLRSDPPTVTELELMREHAAGAFADVAPPDVDEVVAVGGSASSLRRLAGPVLDPAALEGALRRLTAAPVEQVARQSGLEAERVRLLPGAVAVLVQTAAAFGAPLRVARGGLREGILLAGDHELFTPAGYDRTEG